MTKKLVPGARIVYEVSDVNCFGIISSSVRCGNTTMSGKPFCNSPNWISPGKKMNAVSLLSGCGVSKLSLVLEVFGS